MKTLFYGSMEFSPVIIIGEKVLEFFGSVGKLPEKTCHGNISNWPLGIY